MGKLKCIIFDCDGVLVDSETIANHVLLTMAREHGLRMSLEEAINVFSGRELKDCFRQIEKSISKQLPDDFEKEFRKRTFEAFRNELKPVEGVKEFIDSLNVAYCVASSGPVEKIRLNLTITGLIDKFENKIFSSYQINSWKPDPGIFLYAAREMSFPVSECIVIEDSKAGVKAGVSGGFRVFGFACENNAKDLENEGATLFYNYKELPALLEI
ncbi:MAG TPA: HAD-IA family hydrolase [Bacteroidales bacterium]|nr:HAD-IA family hydrolase [Bacteroidales bacterium]